MAILVVGIGSIHVAQSPLTTQFPLFVVDKTCVCVKTRKQTPSINSSETQSDRTLEQVFRSTDGRELFRLIVGTVTSFGSEKLLIVTNASVSSRAVTDVHTAHRIRVIVLLRHDCMA